MTENTVEDIVDQIIKKYRPQRIILFGSAAREDLTPDSDLDFLIIKKDVPYYGRERIQELSRLIERHAPVDFLIYKPQEFQERLRMGDPFLKAIVEEGKVLYG